jgi:hypothetical protein
MLRSALLNNLVGNLSGCEFAIYKEFDACLESFINRFEMIKSKIRNTNKESKPGLEAETRIQQS